jgi:ABC-2 type transport system ATP-binding protein
VIRVERVTHYFGRLKALDDVTFEVPARTVFGFIGPNGAGKTTTLRMMATLLAPDAGRILVAGHDVVEEPDAVRRVLGFMPDGFGVYERVTVDEYLWFFAAAHGIELGVRRRAVEAVVELTELGTLRERLVSTLSKGMKQRLAIARTLLHDPQVLILDEPANGLDPRARIEMRELIEELARLGKTILLSSHILTELSDMCSAVAILEQGKLLAAGTMDAIGERMHPEQAVRVRVLAAADHTGDVLGRLPGVIDVEREPDGDFCLRYQGGDATLAAIVAAAVGAGLPIVRVEPEAKDLERIFLAVTRGNVQ